MLKNAEILLILVLLFTSAFPQHVSTKESDKGLYYEALKTYLEKNEQEYSRLFPERDFRNVIVATDSFITKNLPDKIGVYSINFVSYDELLELVKKRTATDSEEKISVVEVHPIRNEGNKLVVKFVESNARYEKKQLSLAVSDGANIYFSFDCSKQSYIIDRVDFFGI